MNEKQNAQHYFCQSSCLYLTLWPIHFTDFFRYSVHVWIQRIYGHYNISLNFGSTVIFYSLLFIYFLMRICQYTFLIYSNFFFFILAIIDIIETTFQPKPSGHLQVSVILTDIGWSYVCWLLLFDSRDVSCLFWLNQRILFHYPI